MKPIDVEESCSKLDVQNRQLQGKIAEDLSLIREGVYNAI